MAEKTKEVNQELDTENSKPKMVKDLEEIQGKPKESDIDVKAKQEKIQASIDNNLKPLKDKIQTIPADFNKTENEMKANDFRVSPSLAAVKNKELAPSLEIVQAIHNKSIADGLDSEQIKAVDKIAVSLMAKVIEQGKAPTANKEKEQQNELAR
jgi:hypothetical protein